jgi:hypothetical protein
LRSQLFYTAILVCLLSAASAQTPRPPAAQSAPDTATCLHSGDPRTVAWGAYFALRDRRLEFVPDLLTLLAAYQPPEPDSIDGRDRHDAMLAVLDALIQLGADTPAIDLAKIYSEFRAQSLILMSYSSDDASSVLLDILRNDKTSGSAWIAAGNMLFAKRAPGFAAAVLGSLTVHATLGVFSPNSDGGWGGSALCCGAAGQARAKTGWPRVGNYFLLACSDNVSSDAVLFSPGIDAVYYRRTVDATYSRDQSECHCRPDLDLARQQYLAALLDVSLENPPIWSYVSESIVFRSQAGYQHDVKSFIKQEQEQFAATAQRLQRAGLITPEEAASIRPKLVVIIEDLRKDKAEELPEIVDTAENVTISRFGL